MSHDEIINRTIETLSKLPSEKAIEVADFAEFLLQQSDEDILIHGISELVSKSSAFEFLNEDDNIYELNDLKERYK